MTDNEFHALISLLDDEDFEVFEHVEARLIEMGEANINRLEDAWEDVGEGVLRKRLEDVIQEIQNATTIKDLVKWKADGEKDLLRAWFLVSRYFYPNIKFSTYKSKISRLVNRIWLEFEEEMKLPERLMVINRMLYRRERFRSNRSKVYHAENYFINSLFDTRAGGPLSLGMLYLIVCQQLQLSLKALILPKDHFVLAHQGKERSLYINVFSRGSFFTKEDLTRFIVEQQLADDAKYYKSVSNSEIIAEMMRILMICFERQNDAAKAESLRLLINRFAD